jgi:hypothetical protein
MRCMIKLGGYAVLLLCVIIGLKPNAAQAIGQECMTMYYRSRSPGCIDGMLAEFRQRPQSDPNTLIGFLAQIFRTSRDERERVLNAETSDRLKAADVVSLYRAGLLEEAEAFAKANNLSAVADKVRAARLPTLDAVKPAVPADNDLLVGAYTASGDTRVIQRILATYSGADDGMVSDGLRIGFMMSKFGPTLAAKGRKAVTMQAACDRYQCKSDRTKLLHVLTLATALWSLQSLSQQDEGIKNTLSSFFAADARLKTQFFVEQNAFANYLTTIIGLAGLPDAEVLNRSAEIYEKLGPANEAFAPPTNTKK